MCWWRGYCSRKDLILVINLGTKLIHKIGPTECSNRSCRFRRGVKSYKSNVPNATAVVTSAEDSGNDHVVYDQEILEYINVPQFCLKICLPFGKCMGKGSAPSVCPWVTGLMRPEAVTYTMRIPLIESVAYTSIVWIRLIFWATGHPPTITPFSEPSKKHVELGSTYWLWGHQKRGQMALGPLQRHRW